MTGKSFRLAGRHFAAFVAVSVLVSQTLPVCAESLDLSSTAKTQPAAVQQGTVINVGGRPMAVTPGMMLTPAQAMAASQVINSGTQGLSLGAAGNAVGGYAIVGAGAASYSSLAVPKNVSVFGDFSNASTLAVTGNIVNAGRLFGVSNSSTSNVAVFSARNIANLVNALISTIKPSVLVPEFANAISNLNLKLVAAQALTNTGTISSAADLNIVSAVVDSSGGKIEATHGGITFGDGTTGRGEWIKITGGDLVAANGVHINAGEGNISAAFTSLQAPSALPVAWAT